jgi:hypothetical protein
MNPAVVEFSVNSPADCCWPTTGAIRPTGCGATRTGASTNLAKRIKRVAFGIVNWTHWRIRILLHVGRPDWSKSPTISPTTP